jgi:hypothetical protein
MQDGPSPPTPNGRRSYLPLCSAFAGMMLGGLAFALLFVQFRESFGPNAHSASIWPAVGGGAFCGFVNGLLVGRWVARKWK